MRNLTRHISIITLTLLLLTGRGELWAQSDQILAPGKPPLRQSQVNRAIEFYEWAFETDFRTGERERFTSLSVELYKQSPETALQEIKDLSAVLDKVLTQDAEKQNTLRSSFNESFIADLIKSNDQASRLLLEVYSRSRPEAPAGKETATSGTVSAELIGRWVRRAGAGGARDYTGKTLYNSGEDTTFEFSAGGTIQFRYEKNVLSITQCRISEISDVPGRYSVSGDNVTLLLSAGTSVGKNSCDAKGNFNRKLSPSTVTKQFKVKRLESIFRPDAPLILCFDGASDDDCFEKEKTR